MYTIGGRVESESVGPFSDERLDEALGLAVGPRPVGSCSSVFDFEGAARLSEVFRYIAGTVVGEDFLGIDPSVSKPGNRSSKECARCWAFFVFEDLYI